MYPDTGLEDAFEAGKVEIDMLVNFTYPKLKDKS